MKTILPFLLCCIVFANHCHISYAAIREGLYTIKNQDDNYFLDGQSSLVKTASGRNGFNGQRWKVVALGYSNLGFNSYALINELNQNNEVSKAAAGEDGFPEWTRFTLVPVNGEDVFLIRKVRYQKARFGSGGRLENACLLTQGAGARVAFYPRCEKHSSNQQWRFTKV